MDDVSRGIVMVDRVRRGVVVVSRYAVAIAGCVLITSWYGITVVGCVFIVERHFEGKLLVIGGCCTRKRESAPENG